MKRNIFFLAILSFLLFSCKNEEERAPHPHFVQYFIGEYRGGTYRMFALEDKKSGNVTGIGIGLENVVLYQTPEWDCSQNTEEFVKIAARNGDGGYNDWVSPDSYVMRKVFADNFLSVHLTSDRDWDDGHPAGTCLDNLVLWGVSTYSEFIRSGYQDYTDTYTAEDGVLFYGVVLSDVQPRHLEMISDENGSFTSPRIWFLSAPAVEGPHTLTLTITTTEGKVQTPSVTCIPKPFEPAP